MSRVHSGLTASIPVRGRGQDGANPLRVIVCGGRDYSDYASVCKVMDWWRASFPHIVVIHGNARGADTLADRWAKERGVKSWPVPAEWKRDGRKAGPLRNRRMLGMGPDVVVAFPGGRGTADMTRQAEAAGVVVHRAITAGNEARQGGVNPK